LVPKQFITSLAPKLETIFFYKNEKKREKTKKPKEMKEKQKK
jgi:hypothetical protein